jgi:hypothetical protein
MWSSHPVERSWSLGHWMAWCGCGACRNKNLIGDNRGPLVCQSRNQLGLAIKILHALKYIMVEIGILEEGQCH